ncbi:Orotidine 5'-phosphate decarboxylase [Gammaproteobacteria bacterium]
MIRTVTWKQDTVSDLPESDRPISFPDKLVTRAKNIDSRLIVGLDPDIRQFPLQMGEWSPREAIKEFNRLVIEATAEVAVAFKPQIAFYEQYGIEGLLALQDTIAMLRSQGLLCILDAKRNDIEHTAVAYAKAWLAHRDYRGIVANPWQVDALTINPYLGSDGIRPFLDTEPSAGLFVLAKTSNPSSQELQDLKLVSGESVYERVAALSHTLGEGEKTKSGYTRVGLVVGATYPEAAVRLRKIAPRALFLMPGIGAQKGSMEAIKAGSGMDGLGAYAAISRGVLYSFKLNELKEQWQSALCRAINKGATALRDQIRNALDE